MNATYSQQELGKLLLLATVRARTTGPYQYTLLMLRATSSKSRAHQPRAPVAAALRATRLSIKREQGAAFGICVATTKLVRPSHRNAESQEYGS